MRLKIVLFKNQYYIYDNVYFYGPFHSMADAESDYKSKMTENRKVQISDDWTLIKYIG